MKYRISRRADSDIEKKKSEKKKRKRLLDSIE